MRWYDEFHDDGNFQEEKTVWTEHPQRLEALQSPSAVMKVSQDPPSQGQGLSDLPANATPEVP